MPEVEIKADNRTEEEMFPVVECGAVPCGNKIIVQLKYTPNKVGRILVVDETKKTMKYNESIAKVVRIGPTAYRHKDDLMPWAEGRWCEVGDIVRVAKYGGDRWSVPFEDDFVHFITIYDEEVLSVIPSFEIVKSMISFY